MSEAELRQHLRALRATRDGSFAGAAATRQRILVAAHRRRRGRRALFVACASMATLLVLSSAWAELTGALPRVIALVRPAASPVVQEKTPGPARLPPRPAQPPAPEAVASVAAVEAPPVASSRRSIPRRARVASSPAADVQAGAEESAYETAHRAHFVDRDPRRALLGWDAYLAAYPEGRFALEARYNRALTLVRLGRTEEARAALGPFADGRYGTYRRTEARDLLDALANR